MPAGVVVSGICGERASSDNGQKNHSEAISLPLFRPSLIHKDAQKILRVRSTTQHRKLNTGAGKMASLAMTTPDCVTMNVDY